MEQLKNEILCLWFRESLIYVNNCPTRCNTNQSVIILHVHSTCFGCQPHPSSGIHKTVTTASGTVQLPPSNVAKLAWPRLLTALILRFLVFWIKEKSSQGRLWMINLNRLHHSNSVEQTSLKTSQLPGYSRKSLLFTKPNFFITMFIRTSHWSLSWAT